MAYKQASSVIASAQEGFIFMRDFMLSRNGSMGDFTSTGLGWTEHDAVYTGTEAAPEVNSYIVGKFTVGGCSWYCKFLYSSTTKFIVQFYFDWNNSTHTPVGTYYCSKDMLDGVADDMNKLYLFGDDTYMTYAVRSGGNLWYFGSFGLPIGFGIAGNIIEPLATTEAITGGGSQEVSLYDTLVDSLVVGQIVFVTGVSSSVVYAEAVEITAINAGTNTITGVFVNAYDSGAAVGICPCVFVVDEKESVTNARCGPVPTTAGTPPVVAVSLSLTYMKNILSYQGIGYNYISEQFSSMPIAMQYSSAYPYAVIPQLLSLGTAASIPFTDEEVVDIEGSNYVLFGGSSFAFAIKEA